MPKQQQTLSKISRQIKLYLRLAFWFQALLAFSLICNQNYSMWFWSVFDDEWVSWVRLFGFHGQSQKLLEIALWLYFYAILYSAVVRLTYLILSRIYPVVHSWRDIMDSQTGWTFEQVKRNDDLDGKIGFVSLWFSITCLIFLEGLRQSAKSSPFIFILLLWIVFLLPILGALKELREATRKRNNDLR